MFKFIGAVLSLAALSACSGGGSADSLVTPAKVLAASIEPFSPDGSLGTPMRLSLATFTADKSRLGWVDAPFASGAPSTPPTLHVDEPACVGIADHGGVPGYVTWWLSPQRVGSCTVTVTVGGASVSVPIVVAP